MNGFIYFIQDRTGAIKIGYTSEVRKRLASLQCASSTALKVLTAYRVNDPASEERHLHARFAAHRKGGEWFSPAAEIIAFVASKPNEQDSVLVDGEYPRGKVGRPSLSGKGPASRVELKVAPATHAQWSAAATREGLSLSEWLRAAAELAIARGSTR